MMRGAVPWPGSTTATTGRVADQQDALPARVFKKSEPYIQA